MEPELNVQATKRRGWKFYSSVAVLVISSLALLASIVWLLINMNTLDNSGPAGGLNVGFGPTVLGFIAVLFLVLSLLDIIRSFRKE